MSNMGPNTGMGYKTGRGSNSELYGKFYFRQYFHFKTKVSLSRPLFFDVSSQEFRIALRIFKVRDLAFKFFLGLASKREGQQRWCSFYFHSTL